MLGFVVCGLHTKSSGYIFWCLYNFNGDFLNFEAPFDRRSSHSIRDHGNSSCFLFAHDDFLELMLMLEKIVCE